MPIIFQIVIASIVLAFPIAFIIIYFILTEQNTRHIIKSYTDDFSYISKNLKVWIKNNDVFKKKNLFELNIYQPIYTFNTCRLIVNPSNFIVIGESKSFWKLRTMTPIIFELVENKLNEEFSQVLFKKIDEIGEDLEIEFHDKRYSKNMTLVIKNIGDELKERLISVTE